MNSINFQNQNNLNLAYEKELNKLQFNQHSLDKNEEEVSYDNSSYLKSGEDNKSYNTGRWNQSEHYGFIKGCILFGNNWKKVF